MARLLSHALVRKTQLSFSPPLSARAVALTHHHRHRSSKSEKAQLIEVDLDASSSSDGGGEIEIIAGLRRLEEVVQSIIVRRAAPDWLPFLPGSSYWVPPRHGHHIVEVIERMPSVSANPPLTEDEIMSLTTSRGWPSSAFFVEGSTPPYPMPTEVELELRIHESDKDVKG